MNESKIILDSESIRIRYHRIHKNDYTGSKLKKPIFIIGVPHSGTSVLSSLFNIHPDVAMWTEAPEVWEPYWAEGVDSDYNRLVPVEENYVKDFDIERITDAFSRYVSSQGKTRFMNKNPRNTVRISYLKKIFPDCKIIHILRDPRDVVNSITRNMPDFMIEEICERWINSINHVKIHSKSISKSDFYEIKYEEFCERTKEILTESYKMCDLEINETILEALPSKLTNFNGKWKTEMENKLHTILRKKLEFEMTKKGYQW